MFLTTFNHVDSLALFSLFRTQIKLESLQDAVVLDDDDDDSLSDKLGCPNYVSPEILTSMKGSFSGKAADCWSLGVVIYTMLVGRYPFNDSDPSMLFCKIRKGAYVMPDSLSSDAKCLIRSLLRKEPSERLTAEEILYHKWFNYMSSLNSNYYKFHCSSPLRFHNSNYNLISTTASSYDCSPIITSTYDCKVPDQTVPDLNGSDDGSYLVIHDSLT